MIVLTDSVLRDKSKEFATKTDVIEHYDKLIDEGNDPVYDPAPLKNYMDKWDGQLFIDAMELTKTKSVLEIGVGTGRLAIKVAPLCAHFFGIDISPKTVEKAKQNLKYSNAKLRCSDFFTCDFCKTFDVIYSSLTFMHIKEKQLFINKVCSLLNLNGRFVLSIDKNQEKYITFGDRKIQIYPDVPSDIIEYFKNANIKLFDCLEVEFAYIFIGIKTE